MRPWRLLSCNFVPATLRPLSTHRWKSSGASLLQVRQRVCLIANERGSMKHGFPKWFPFLLVGILVGAFGGFAETLSELGNFSSLGANVTLSLVGTAAFAFLVWSFLYAWRYSVQVVSDSISITGIFHTRIIPLSSIAQVVTASS